MLKTRTRQFVDLHKHFAKFRDVNGTRWSALSEEARFGLTFDEFQMLKDKYGAIAAAPIISRKEKYVGCVTADMPPGKRVQESEVLESLASTAQFVREVL